MMTAALNLPISFEEPTWLWLALLVPALVVLSLRSLAGLDPTRRVLSLAARGMLVLLLAMCLAQVQYVQRNDDLTVIFLMDRSYSTHKLQTAQEAYIQEAAKTMPPEDRLGLIDFARHAYLQQLPMRGGYFIEPGRLPAMPNTDRTDIAAALRLAMAMFPHDTAKRIVLMSDGNDNMGDVLTEARRAKADGVPVDVVPLWYQHSNEVFFERMMAPTFAEEGEQVPIRLVLNTQKSVSGTLSIYQNGRLVPLPPEASRVQLQPGSNTFMAKLPVTTGSTQRYEASFRPDDETMDSTPLNNTASAFSFVSGTQRVLLVTANPMFDQPLYEALRSEKVQVEMVDVSALGTFELPDMLTYSSIVLANIPASAFTDEQKTMLASYVRDWGSGLVMVGGDESFGAGGWIGTPVEQVMPVSFELKHKRVIPRGALVIILHSCEIARGNYWGQEMAKKSVDTVSSRDYLGVVAYTYSPGGVNWEVPLDLCTNKEAVKAKISKTQIGDMPDFGTAMQMAYDGLVKGRGRDAAQKHVIIISDGDPSPPSQALLQSYASQKITVSTIAIGWGAHVDQRWMSQIAKATSGRFYPAQNPKELPQIFVKESKVVRRPLIVEEAFTPQVFHAESDLLARTSFAGGMPPLEGLVLTSPKEDPTVQVPLIRATDDGNDPVLAHWQCELGKTVAFTSGFWPRWGASWTHWPQFAQLWAQIVRWSMRQETPANFDTFVKIDGNRGRVVVDAMDKEARYLTQLRFQSKLFAPSGQEMPLELRQTGPGHYEAEFTVEDPGQYLASLQVYDGGKAMGSIRTGVSVPFSPEYRSLETNETVLRQIQEVSGGRWLEAGPVADNVFSHDLPPTEARRPAWTWVLAWLVLPVFLLDVAVRRLASWLALSIAVEVLLLVVLLFGVGWWHDAPWGIVWALVIAELVGWAIRWRYIRPMFEFLTHPVVALGQAGERSASALGQLKGVRDRVREGGAERAAAEPAEEEPPPTISKEQARRRFDVGDEAAAAPAGDIHSTLGGAKTSEPYREKRRAPAPSETPAGEGEDMTSRLLRAKRRAREDQEERRD